MGISNDFSDFLVTKARAMRFPITVNFELLPVCNLDCKMCYIRSSWDDVRSLGGLLNVDKWLSIAKELLEAGTLFILLTGGEIFLYPEFKKLYIELYKMGFVITLNTNGTMINEDVIEWLKEYPPKMVSLSLYGASDEVYQSLCGRKGMFTRFNHAVELLQEAGIMMEFKTVINPLNVDDLPNCIQYANSKNIHYDMATYSFPAMRKIKKEDQIRFNPKEEVNAIIYRNKLIYTDEQYIQSAKDYISKYQNTEHRSDCKQVGFTCSACNSSCWINWQGKMIPCAMMNDPYEEPFKIGFLNAWENLKRKVDQIEISSECANCDKREICTVCPAALYCENGDFSKPSKHHCEVTDLKIKKMLEIIKEK